MPESEVKELMEEIRAYHQETAETTKKIAKILLGNGEAGLCEQMRTIQSHMKAIWTMVGVFGATLLAGVIHFFFRTGS